MPKLTQQLGNPLKNGKHQVKSPWGDLGKLVGKKAKKSKKH